MLLDPAVLEVEEQPVRIFFTDDEGKRHRYTPDFRVRRRDAPTILAEVKLEKDLTPELQPYFDAGAMYAAERGWIFLIWTEKAIRTDRLKNARFLEMYRGRRVEAGVAEWVLSELRRSEIGTVGDLVDIMGARDDARAEKLSALWCLVASGQIHVDLDREIDNDSEIHVVEGGGNGS